MIEGIKAKHKQKANANLIWDRAVQLVYQCPGRMGQLVSLDRVQLVQHITFYRGQQNAACLISPVYAPLPFTQAFCAATLISLCCSFCCALAMCREVGAKTTSAKQT